MVSWHRQASGLFSFLAARFQSGGALKGEHTVKPIFTSGLVNSFSNETRPLFVFLNDNKLICFLPHSKTSLNISEVARLLDFPAIEGKNSGNENMPTLTPVPCSKGLAAFANHSSIRHPSAFFQLVVQTSKPASVAITRWLIQEVVPRTAVFKVPLAAVTDDEGLKKLIGRHRAGMSGQVLVKLETVQVGCNKPSRSADEMENMLEGEERCQKN